MRSSILTFVKFAVAVGLIALLFYKGLLDLSVLKQLTDPVVLIAGLSLVGISLTLQVWRWFLLLEARNLPARFVETWKLFHIGLFFNYALPGSVGGDVVRAYYIVQEHRERRMDALLTVVVDRLLGLYAMVVIGTGAILFNLERIQSNNQLVSLSIATLGLFLFMTTFWFASFSKRLKRLLRVESALGRLPMSEKLIKAYQAAQGYGERKPKLFFAFGLSIVAQFFSIAFMMLVGHTIGERDVSLATYLFAVPLGSIIASVPIAPAGLGVGQVAFLVLFQMYSGEKSLLGQTAITAFQIALLAWGMLGALFYVRRPRMKV